MKISENISLAKYTTFKVGGPARFFCVVKDEAELREAARFAQNGAHDGMVHGGTAHDGALPIAIFGGGSNVLVSDAGFPGLVVKMEIGGVKYEKEQAEGAAASGRGADVLVTVGAGENWDDLVAETVMRDLWGLENLSAIPGTVGAAPVQNIGAYGAEAKDAIESVRAVRIGGDPGSDAGSDAGGDAETIGETRVFSNAECRFAYRDSFFKSSEGKKWVITAVTFRLHSAASPLARPNVSYKDLAARFGATSPSLADIRRAVIEIRSGKFPDLSKIGTAGSFWKNPIIARADFEALAARYPGLPSFPASFPVSLLSLSPAGAFVKIPLAWILDKVCGLKGYSKGAVGLFAGQPLVLVAEPGAVAADIDAFAQNIAAEVMRKTSIAIEPEVVFLG